LSYLLFGSPGNKLWIPKLDLSRNYIAIPAVVNSDNIHYAISYFKKLAGLRESIIFGNIKGLRVYLVSDKEDLSYRDEIYPSSSYDVKNMYLSIIHVMFMRYVLVMLIHLVLRLISQKLLKVIFVKV